VFYTMLTDGKLNCFMGMFYIGILCFGDIVPIFSTLAPHNPSRKVTIKPLKIFLLAVALTFLIGMVRILPTLEHINAKGGWGNIDLFFYAETYGFSGYTFQQLWQEVLGWKGQQGYVTIGWLPVILFGIALFFFWKKSLPWAITLILFGWLILANNAPVDLFKMLWNLPIFNAVRQPAKYFSFQIVFTFAVASGQVFWLLTKLRPRWLEHLVALMLIIAGVWFLYPKNTTIQRNTYDFEMPSKFLAPTVSLRRRLFFAEEEFFNVQGLDLLRNRTEPFNAVAYLNLIRNIGTIDWYTGIPLAENAIPKYFVDANNNYIPNPEYRGEVFFLAPEEQELPKSTAQVAFRPNSIAVEVSLQKPGTLVINQNYHRDWHANQGELFNKNGLLALRLQETGDYTIRLHYLSRSFYAGLAISFASLVAIVLVVWAYRSGHLRNWTEHPLPLVKRSSQAILWLID